MSAILVASLLVLFLLVKAYFSNSYVYAMQDNLANKNTNDLDIGAIVDNRYDQFNMNKKPIVNILNLNKKNETLLEKAFGNTMRRL
jgi:hypothetical protein